MPLQQTYLSYQQYLYSHYYLCHYLPATTGRDHLSHSLLKFKKGRQPDLDGWLECSLELIALAPIPPGATIVRALHHDETAASSHSSLDLLGQELARRFNHQYFPRLLQKSHPNRPVKMFSKPRREEELAGLYHIDRSLLPHPPGHWLIIDDILTSGCTLRAILQAIHEAWPPEPDSTPIHIFTLAKATTTLPPHPAPLQGLHYRFEDADGAWTLAEDQIPYYSLIQLKNIILRDAF